MLEKSYLCGVNNNSIVHVTSLSLVVICLKNRTFVVSTITYQAMRKRLYRCDLLEKSYLCGVNNNDELSDTYMNTVVICLKNRTFVVSTITDVI